MTANDQRAKKNSKPEPEEETTETNQDEGAGTARSQANAKAAAEEAARLAEEAAQGEDSAEEPGAEEAQAETDPTAALQAEIDDLKERLQRAMAETENVRRRVDRERQEAMKYAVAPLAKDLLGVADNLRRALDSVPADAGEQDGALKNLLTGVEMTEKELLETLAKHGVQRLDVEPGERFDPHHHEAMFEVPTEEHAPGRVVQVVQSGYMLHDRLLRPARVGVARAGDGGGAANGSGNSVDTKA